MLCTRAHWLPKPVTYPACCTFGDFNGAPCLRLQVGDSTFGWTYTNLIPSEPCTMQKPIAVTFVVWHVP